MNKLFIKTVVRGLRMSYNVKIFWKKNLSEAFVDRKYSRFHTWSFDGGIEIPASSSPHVVPVPMSDESTVDPEEAFVAAVSSCHMLWFLSIAAEKNFIVESYEDNAIGVLGKNGEGKLAMTKIILSRIYNQNWKALPELLAPGVRQRGNYYGWIIRSRI